MPSSARCLPTIPSYEVAMVMPPKSSGPFAVPGLVA